MYWVPINKDQVEIMREVAGFEQNFPGFYRDANNTWTVTEDEAVTFYQSCPNLYALYEDENLVGLVYFEEVSEHVMNVHCDLQRGAKLKELIPVIAQIRDNQFLNGMRLCMAWVMKKNRPVRTMMEAIGFKPTFLTMKQGSSHGKILEWTQLAITEQSYSLLEVTA